MFIEELRLKNFGKFQEEKIDLGPRINIIYGENEAGKSTLHAFIKGMFFGITKPRGRVTKDDNYTRFLPWHNLSKFDGSMDIVMDEKRYRIYRNFHKDYKDYRILDLQTGREVDEQSFQVKHDLHNFTESNYKNTISIEQTKVRTEKELAVEIQNYIANLTTSKNSEVNVQNAIIQLQTKRKNIENSFTNKRLQELEVELENNIANQKRMEELTTNLGELEKTHKRNVELLEKSTQTKTELEEINHNLLELSNKLVDQMTKERMQRELLELEELKNLEQNLERKLQKSYEEWNILDNGKIPNSETPNRETPNRETPNNEMQNRATVDSKPSKDETANRERRIKSIRDRNSILCFLFLIIATFLVITTNKYHNNSEMLIIVISMLSGFLYYFNNRQNNKLLDENRDRLENQKNQLENQKNQLKNPLDQLENQKEELKKRKDELEEVHKRREKILRSYQIEAYNDLERLYEEQIKFGMRAETFDKNKKELINNLEHLECQNTKQEYEEVMILMERVKWELNQLDEKQMNLELDENEFQELSRKKFEEEEEVKAINLAITTIDRLSMKIHDGFGSNLNTLVSNIIMKVTDGKYQDIKIDERLNIKVADHDEYVDLEKLSIGTIEQVYLALRMASSELIFENRQVPLILDECFVYYDKNRLKGILKQLCKVKDKQILIFTCHEREKEILDEMGVEYKYLNL